MVFWMVSCTLLLTEIVFGETIRVALDDEPAAALVAVKDIYDFHWSIICPELVIVQRENPESGVSEGGALKFRITI